MTGPDRRYDLHDKVLKEGSMREKLVRIEWDADDDSYLLFLASSGTMETAVARLYIAELEELGLEIKRFMDET